MYLVDALSTSSTSSAARNLAKAKAKGQPTAKGEGPTAKVLSQGKGEKAKTPKGQNTIEHFEQIRIFECFENRQLSNTHFYFCIVYEFHNSHFIILGFL